jgi:hypothetical protein
MIRIALCLCAAIALASPAACNAGAQPLTLSPKDPLPPIQTVAVGENQELRVNGKSFLPIMSWLQDAKSYKTLRGLGINTFCGNHGFSAKAHCGAAKAAGGYAVSLFKTDGDGAIGDPYLLGWLHGDEPDLAQTKSDAVVEPRQRMKLNAQTPFSRIVDGVTNTWTVLHPLQGAAFTIKLDKPVTVVSLAAHLTISDKLPVAKQIVLYGDGEKLLTADLENKKGRQKFELPKPATFKELRAEVTDVYPGGVDWGSIGEIEAFDANGKSVLVSKPYTVPRQSPAEVLEHYNLIRQHAGTRPVFLTLCTYFMKESAGKYTDAQKQTMYPAYVRATDVAGFDVYPIYGSGTPGHLNWPAYGVTQLRELAGPKRPIYAWIETSKGSKWMTYSKQPDVLPMHTRHEVWGAIIRGATVIGYFTHAWKPSFREFAPTAEMQAELKRLNGQLTRLAPDILAPVTKRRVQMTIEGGLQCHLKATERKGTLTIFAQNQDLGINEKKAKQFQPISPRGGKATFTVAGLKAGTKIEVVDENRTITATQGGFTDEFGKLAEHVYRIGM